MRFIKKLNFWMLFFFQWILLQIIDDHPKNERRKYLKIQKVEYK